MWSIPMAPQCVATVEEGDRRVAMVVCGKEDTLRPLVAELDRRGLQNRLIPGNIALHSSAMDPLESDVLEVLEIESDSTWHCRGKVRNHRNRSAASSWLS